MHPNKATKEEYTRPEAESICIAPMESIVQNISNPGGDVPPVDPIEE